ncbi:MAG: polyprenyl synthetase family protein [Chloroflexota bacterium]
MLESRLTELSELVGRWMRPYVAPQGGPLDPFDAMLAYHVGWADQSGAMLDQPVGAGKRLRPALAILVCEAFGGSVEDARGPATAIELVHNFSLVHDDVQDQSDRRRGRPTVWALWGAAQAINVGDSLFAAAQIALTDHISDDGRAVRASAIMNDTCRRLVGGQYLDLALESALDATREHYERMIDGKTAALVQCSARLGALMGGADQATEGACGEFGRLLGVAFQYQDDVLGVWGDPAVTGKPAGDDVRSKKKALPLITALTTATGGQRDRLRHLCARDGLLADGEVEEVIGILDALDIRARCQAEVERAFAVLIEALERAVRAERAGPLRELCEWILARDR